MPPSETPVSEMPRYAPSIEVVSHGETYARISRGKRVLVVVDDRATLMPRRTFCDRWPGARS